jgi:adenylate cyclase class 2
VTVAAAGARRREVEVKVPAPDLDCLRRTLAEEGARLLAAAHFEANDLYDRGEGELAGRGFVLRLRRTDAGASLTFKGPARFESGIKSREEHETPLGDADAARRILESLGYERRFRYEKRREEWGLEECAVALDETPIGGFVEIEGDPPAIRRVLQRLGLDFSEAVPYSYAELYRRRRRDDPALPGGMVFKDR